MAASLDFVISDHGNILGRRCCQMFQTVKQSKLVRLIRLSFLLTRQFAFREMKRLNFSC